MKTRALEAVKVLNQLIGAITLVATPEGARGLTSADRAQINSHFGAIAVALDALPNDTPVPAANTQGKGKKGK